MANHYINLHYSYDNVGNVLDVKDNADASGHLIINRNYKYDDLYRLKQFTAKLENDQIYHNEIFQYDDVGNILLHTGFSDLNLSYPVNGQTSTLLGVSGVTPLISSVL